MGISTTSSSTSSGTASIDVASIVAQLMASENKPMTVLKDKITGKTTLISDLGTLKSKVSTFQTALKSLQDPAAMSALAATSSNESIVQISSSAGAIKGQHDIVVNKVAQPAQITFNGFDSGTANAGLLDGDTFSITVGARVHTYTPVDKTLAETTIDDLKNWVNGLSDNLSANVVQTSGSNYALMIQGTEPGTDNAITFSHTPVTTVETTVTGTGAGADSNKLAGFVAGDRFILTAGDGTTFINSSFTSSTTMGEVKTWVDVVSSSSINQSNELVLSNGVTYSTTRSAGDLIVGSTGSPSDSAGFQDGETFTLTTADLIPLTFTTTFNTSTTIGDVQSWIASQLPASSINGATKALTLNDTAASYSHEIVGLGSPLKRPTVVAARDASFTLDGLTYTRSSNTVTDALTGVTINLIKSDTASQSISVNKGPDKSPDIMQGFVDAFNDLVTTAKKLSARASAASGVTTNGSLSNSPTALNFLSQVKSMLSGDIHYTLGGTASIISLGELGFEMQYDGTAKFNATTFKSVSNASAILASGIKVGYQTYVVRDPETGVEISKNTTDITLDSYLTSLLKATTTETDAGTQTLAGAFDQMIKNEQSNIDDLNKKEARLQQQLDQKQTSYTNQYSALNKLLFELSNTSNSLTSALNGLTNGQNNN